MRLEYVDSAVDRPLGAEAFFVKSRNAPLSIGRNGPVPVEMLHRFECHAQCSPPLAVGGYQRFDIRIEQRIAVENQDFVSSGLCQGLLDRASGAQRFAFDRVDEFESGKSRGFGNPLLDGFVQIAQ